MKKISLALSLCFLFSFFTACVPQTPAPTDSEPPAPAPGIMDPAGDPVISELMADNKNLCMGHGQDWVELYSPAEAPLLLDGYFLTDDPAVPEKYPLAGNQIPGEGYLVIVFSPEASFHLSAKGETVYLTRGGEILSRLTYPASENGKSFDPQGECEYPTPGFANTQAGYLEYLETLTEPELLISEVIASNSKYLPVKGQFYDLVEVKNNSGRPLNLSEYTLSDKRKEPARYRFPDMVLQPGEYYLVYCSGNGALGPQHASFKISASQGETVYLAKDGVILDLLAIPSDLSENESYGRDGLTPLYYSVPTPGGANGEGHLTGVAAPEASLPSGVYKAPFSISLKGDGTVYYTLDGSRPTENSSVYTDPVWIDGTVTVRTFCVSGTRKSVESSFTYLVGATHDLPVISVSIPKLFLVGENEGILNHIGVTYEYECQVTLIENGEEKFSLPCGFRLHGNGSRQMPKQNFQLRFRSEYGVGKLKYKLFENRDFDEFNSLLLKGGSEDWGNAVLKDELATLTAEGVTALYTQAYKPVVLYLGGEYWGIYYLRERFSDDYVASHLNVPEESVDLLYSSQGYAQAGSAAEFTALKNYVSTHDMTQDEHYRYLCNRIDVNSLMDWYICRSFMGDKDLANIRRFRSTEGDGKWRWMYFDLDWAFTVTNDSPLSGIVNNYNGEPVLIQALLKHPEGRDAFLKRYAYLLETVLNEAYMGSVLDSIVADISTEIPRDRARWGKTEAGWNGAVARVRNYFSGTARTERVKADLKEYFQLTEEEMISYFGA